MRHWWWRWQFAVVAAALIFFLLSLSSVFLSLLCFFFFFFFRSSPSLLLSLFVFCPLSLYSSFLLYLLLLLCSLVFMGKKQGRKRTGWPLCCRPPPPLQHMEIVGQVEVLGRCLFELKRGRKGSENTGEHSFLPLFLCTSKGRRKFAGAVPNNTVLGFVL